MVTVFVLGTGGPRVLRGRRGMLTMKNMLAAAVLLLALAKAGAEGESNTDIEFVQRQLTGLYQVTPTTGDTNGGDVYSQFSSLLVLFFRICLFSNIFTIFKVHFSCRGRALANFD